MPRIDKIESSQVPANRTLFFSLMKLQSVPYISDLTKVLLFYWAILIV